LKLFIATDARAIPRKEYAAHVMVSGRNHICIN